MASLSVPVPSAFVTHVDSLLVRLGYLYPDVEWLFEPTTGNLNANYKPEAHSAETLAKDVSFQLYREKIHQDTLDVRRKIYEAI